MADPDVSHLGMELDKRASGSDLILELSYDSDDYVDDDDIADLEKSSDDVESSESKGSHSTKQIFLTFRISSEDLPGKLESEVSSSQPSVTLTETVSAVSKDSTVLEPEPSEVINELEATAIISVLEDAVDQLRILGLAMREPIVPPDMEYQSPDEKYRNQIAKATIIDLETDQPIKKVINSSYIVKVQRDRGFLEKTLSKTLEELVNNGTYATLLSVVNQEKYSHTEEEKLLTEERENSKQVTQLLQEVKDDKKNTAEALQGKDELLAQLKDCYQDEYFTGKMKLKFVGTWETARQEQNSLKQTMEQQGYQNELDTINFDFDIESRVHNEIENYIRQSQSKLEEEIEMWMERYDQEVEQREVDLNVLKQERAVHYKQFEDLALLYQHHKNEITEYLEKKAIKEQIRAHEQFLYDNATRIQAWWRGIMVRHHLGPFRKKKGKGKDKKGKGKKSKK